MVGAYVNITEPYYQQTPLMRACQYGTEDIIRLFILQGAHVNSIDYAGRSSAHYGVYSDSEHTYNALREADVDFDVVDNDGNCPLHIAAELGSVQFAVHILLGGGNPSIQNNEGNQPAHIACRYNQIELLKQICVYDEHIGRVNYAHQTPLGVAKFNGSKECQQFLIEHFKHIDPVHGRNETGSIWWDKQIDDVIGEWKVVVNSHAERSYVNTVTGEVTYRPPSLPAAVVAQTAKTHAKVPMRRRVNLVKEGNKLSKHDYYKDYAENEMALNEYKKVYYSIVTIQKFARRKLAYMMLSRLKK